MRYHLIIAAIIISASLQTSAGAEYNLATQKDEFILIPSEKEENMGRNLSKQVEKKFELDPDVLLQTRVKEVGDKIVQVCDRRSISYHFAVLADKEEINAFSLPGGYIYIFRGMLDKIENDDELAGVLAHEIAHVAARHSVKKMQASFGNTIAQLAIARAETDNLTRARAHQALIELMLWYSREDEVLADRLAVKYMKLAGYNPEGVVTFLNRLMEIQRKAPIKRYRDYRSHPYLSERLSVSKEEIYGKMDFRDYINVRDETLSIK